MPTTDYSNNKAISPDYSYLTGYFGDPADIVENLPQVMLNPVNHGENTFTKALIDALSHYSSKLRSATMPSAYLERTASASGSQCLNNPEAISVETQLLDIPEELSPEDVDEIVEKRATNLLYTPKAPWNKHSAVPIADVVIEKELYEDISTEMYLKQGRVRGQKEIYISKTWKLDNENWTSAFCELALYSSRTHLLPLQGIFIPRLIGIYREKGTISITMGLPPSKFWVEASCDMSKYLKRKCLLALDAIHARGVLYNSIELRNILINEHGDVFFINFHQSRSITPEISMCIPQASDEDLLLEKRLLRFKLDYEDSRVQEVERRRRALTRRRIQNERTAHIARGEGVPTLTADDEKEIRDSDDVPIPKADPWFNCWLVRDPEPECHIVSGDSEEHVATAINEFLAREYEMLDKDSMENTGDEHRNAQARDQESSSGTLSTQIHATEAPVLRRSPRRARVNGSPKVDRPAKPCNPEVIHIPHRGYKGTGGFIVPNQFNLNEASRLRFLFCQQRSQVEGIECQGAQGSLDQFRPEYHGLKDCKDSTSIGGATIKKSPKRPRDAGDEKPSGETPQKRARQESAPSSRPPTAISKSQKGAHQSSTTPSRYLPAREKSQKGAREESASASRPPSTKERPQKRARRESASSSRLPPETSKSQKGAHQSSASSSRSLTSSRKSKQHPKERIYKRRDDS